MTAPRNDSLAPSRGRSWSLLLAVLLLLLIAAIATGRILLNPAGCGAVLPLTATESLVQAVVGILTPLAFAALGVLIVRYQPANRVGWLCLASGIGLASTVFLSFYLDCALAGVLVDTGIAFLALVNYSFGWLVLIPLFILLPLLFPDGHFLSPRFRKLSLVVFGLVALMTLALVWVPDFRNSFGVSYPLDNPFGLSQLPPWWGQIFQQAIFLLILFAALVGILSMILRLRRSRGVERQQMKWFAYFLATAVAIQIIVFEFVVKILFPLEGSRWLDGLYAILVIIVFLGFPLTIGIAVFKYRLYDIDVIIRRTLVYGALTLTLALIYFGSVVLMQGLFVAVAGQQSAVAVVISTLVIAALFTPLRRRIQNDIDRRFFRKKYDAEKTLQAFALTARDETNLDSLTAELLRVVEETMQPEHVSLWLKPTADRRQSDLIQYAQ